MSLEFEDTTEVVIGSAFEVYNILGYGFLEKVYQRALQVDILMESVFIRVNPWFIDLPLKTT